MGHWGVNYVINYPLMIPLVLELNFQLSWLWYWNIPPKVTKKPRFYINFIIDY